MKQAIMAIASTALLALCIAGCATATAASPEKSTTEFQQVSDRYFASPVPQGAARVVAEQDEKASQSQQEPISDEFSSEVDYEPTFGYYETYTASQPSVVRGNPDGLNSFDGVNYHEGRTETYYSADNAVYRDQLTVDDQGFYRDDQGRYAVAVSDMPEGTVFQGSQGECIVVDSGCEPGTTDYAVSGW